MGASNEFADVVMRTGWNGLDLGKALETETARIATTLPLGVSLAKITDQAVNIADAVNEFMIKLPQYAVNTLNC